MASKIKEGIIGQYKTMNDINQIMKTVSGFYCISLNRGNILTKSINPRFEKIGRVNDLSSIHEYLGYGVLPNQFFDFNKAVKKSTIKELQTDESLFLSGEDKEEEEVKIELKQLMLHNIDILLTDKTSVNFDKDKQLFIETLMEREKGIVGECYLWYDLFIDVVNNSTNYPFEKIPQTLVEQMKAGNPIRFESATGVSIDMTIQIFPTIKKDTELHLHILDHRDVNVPKKRYFVIEEKHKPITLYTLGAVYDFSKIE